MNQPTTNVRILNISDMVEENGKTLKENNLEIQHSIPLFTMVEVELEASDVENGLRYFVHSHSRDCDGTPLYRLTTDVKLVGKEIDLKDAIKTCRKDLLEGVWIAVDYGRIVFNYPESCLKVIKSAEEIISKIHD